MTIGGNLRIGFILGGFAVLVGFLAALPLFLEREEPTRQCAPKVFRRVLCEDIALGQSGLYGVDLIRCGACRIEKMKRGVLTFGGYNELVVDDLSVVIPPRVCETNAMPQTGASNASPKRILRELGIGEEFFSMRNLPFRFSGLRVNRLSVSRLEGTNVVPRFTAAQGVAGRGGLSLTGCRIVQASATNVVPKAVLEVKPTLHLVWEGGCLDI